MRVAIGQYDTVRRLMRIMRPVGLVAPSLSSLCPMRGKWLVEGLSGCRVSDCRACSDGGFYVRLLIPTVCTVNDRRWSWSGGVAFVDDYSRCFCFSGELHDCIRYVFDALVNWPARPGCWMALCNNSTHNTPDPAVLHVHSLA